MRGSPVPGKRAGRGEAWRGIAGLGGPLIASFNPEMRIVAGVVCDELREVLDHAPPGIFNGRSWAYWNLKLGRTPAPPLPERRFP